MKSRPLLIVSASAFAGFLLGAATRGNGDLPGRLDRIEHRLEALEVETTAAAERADHRADTLADKIDRLQTAKTEDGYETLTISHAYWMHSLERQQKIPDEELRTRDDGSGHLLVHVDELRPHEGVSQYRSFYGHVDKDFVLRAPGEDDVTLRAERGMWMQEFYLRIPPDEFQKMKAGVAYTLEPLNRHASVKWRMLQPVQLARSSDDDGRAP